MWVYCLAGFFSICQKPWDKASGTLTIRARVREDLENLRFVLPELGEIKSDPRADYLVRAQAPRKAVARVFGAMARLIKYDNFKAAVQPLATPERRMIYHTVHAETLRLDQTYRDIGPWSPLLPVGPVKKKKRPRKKLPVYNR